MDKDTDGSNLIKSLLLDDVEEPIYLHAWGGQSTIARALRSIEEQHQGAPQWPAIRAKVIGKAVIHPSGDQDNTAANYIRPTWPEIRYGNGGGAGGAGLSYNAQRNAAEADQVFYSAAWMQEHIASKGDFGRLQPVWGDGKQMVKGDKFDYFGAPPPTGTPGAPGAGVGGPGGPGANTGPRPPSRFLRPLMHDLAGRMTWAITRRIPVDAKPGDTIHVIAEASDDGKLPLTRYARAVVTVN
jgi:hypothetical protein